MNSKLHINSSCVSFKHKNGAQNWEKAYWLIRMLTSLRTTRERPDAFCFLLFGHSKSDNLMSTLVVHHWSNIWNLKLKLHRLHYWLSQMPWLQTSFFLINNDNTVSGYAIGFTRRHRHTKKRSKLVGIVTGFYLREYAGRSLSQAEWSIFETYPDQVTRDCSQRTM